ncbi:hypothetical protein VTG60DRAFT_4510 [Thermothelomyces hinnuleus]
MHHMSADEINAFWHFERRHCQHQQQQQQQGAWRPLLLGEIYHEFVAPYLHLGREATREDWDNLAADRFYLDPDRARHGAQHHDSYHYPAWQLNRTRLLAEQTEPERAAHRSPADCAAACRALPAGECFRYKYADSACSVAASFALGRPVARPAEAAKRTVSGWEVDRIRDWARRQGGCAAVEWPAVERGDGI